MTKTVFLLPVAFLALANCATTDSGETYVPISSTEGTLMGGPTVEQRNKQIATEQTGDFYYGRRYRIIQTRFWGYLRKPRKSGTTSKLVMINESKKLQPDRRREDIGASGFGFDQNYEYRLYGNYTGKKVYDPNSNLFLPEFMLTNYQLVNKTPGWIFTPNDRYDPNIMTLRLKRRP